MCQLALKWEPLLSAKGSIILDSNSKTKATLNFRLDYITV